MDEVEIINLHKRCNKTGAKVETKRGAKAKAGLKTGAKAASKIPRSKYHLFLREQLEKMTGEERRDYRSIVSKRWKEIKEDPARLSEYNDRAGQMKNEPEKPFDRQHGTASDDGQDCGKKKTNTVQKSTQNPSVC